MKFREVAVLADLAIRLQEPVLDLGGGQAFPVQLTRNGLGFVDVDLEGYGTLHFIEQNKEKQSRFTDFVNQGHSITWIVKVPGFEYMPGGVVDGEYTDNIHDTLRRAMVA